MRQTSLQKKLILVLEHTEMKMEGLGFFQWYRRCLLILDRFTECFAYINEFPG